MNRFEQKNFNQISKKWRFFFDYFCEDEKGLRGVRLQNNGLFIHKDFWAHFNDFSVFSLTLFRLKSTLPIIIIFLHKILQRGFQSGEAEEMIGCLKVKFIASLIC